MNRFQQIDALCQSYIDRGYFPSATVRVFDENQTLYQTALGRNRMPGGEREAVTIDTVYDMASCTKIATSTQILLLAEEEGLDLLTPLGEILPEVSERSALKERLSGVTLRQLLTHTSGLVDWYPFYVKKGEDFYDIFESFIGDTKVQEGMVYSDINFMLLGKVLEKLRKKDLRACLADLKKRLGAEFMDFGPEAALKAGRQIAPSGYGNGIEERMVRERGLMFYDWRSRTEPCLGVNDGNACYYFDDAAGHAGIMADAAAYEKLCQYYVNSDSIHFAASMEPFGDTGRGLGWQIDERLYPQGCGHTGFSGTWIYINKEKRIGAVALTNRLAYPVHHSTNTNEFRRALAKAINEILR